MDYSPIRPESAGGAALFEGDSTAKIFPDIHPASMHADMIPNR